MSKPDGWDDGLAEPVQLPAWFTPLITTAVLTSVVLAVYALTR